MSLLFNNPNQKDIRRRLRSDPTPAERTLWSLISRGQIGFRFRRQYGIGSYVVDFNCPQTQLVIEVDGDSHFTPQAEKSDKERDRFLIERGIRVLRVTNSAVHENPDAVLQMIKTMLASHPSQPPLVKGR